ncbi:tRNA 5-methylaminomethyl-2-thiouridylate-methyltransferase, putative [Theileria equi strain WA]|uniref:tRNA-5-taurinomethyluridine 2-sulfurtransferase n=1 Tax=Theileria equi strain WA TaxID=1537102 RepID=L0AU86_THEEQ|nr:tRNA 5-methylaminomethyl-2-thiouridylate-methyltransferase, putative [Theileria equi strain WA]AFZ79207.1 tRNA 5-methylaminomethyl-2-thiouridylate-methyltransferase, putative [Theileria equi strain WA]|eukprot:XP_004828873.1 tRNA 5-methylaminomethyl-2-thiouridylate-methyltransferase, putative [Theileria equi strain WA]
MRLLAFLSTNFVLYKLIVSSVLINSVKTGFGAVGVSLNLERNCINRKLRHTSLDSSRCCSFVVQRSPNFAKNSKSVPVNSYSGPQSAASSASWDKVNKSTKDSIDNLIKTKLSNTKDATKYLQSLAEVGSSVFESSPSPSILYNIPRDLKSSKTFNTLDLYSEDGLRDYFVFKAPESVQYKLVTDCISLIYISVFVDKHNRIYVDGVSDSLIVRGILAILLSKINGKSMDEVLSMNQSDVEFGEDVSGIGLIRRNGIQLILNHVKNECKIHKREHNVYQVKEYSTREKVALLISGGVDSSVALWLLKNRGYHVEAFYLKVWDLLDTQETCSWATDIQYAMDVCKMLDVKLHIIPFKDLYYSNIIQHLVKDSREGETPNPDVECNNRIKFGEFLKFAIDWEFDYVASGHYARIKNDIVSKDHPEIDLMGSPEILDILEGCKYDSRGFYNIRRLCLSRDINKDQTYFLSRLKQSQLSKLIFPIGDFEKKKVRDIANTVMLPTRDRKDSVGLCFLGNVHLSSFLTRQIGESKGPIIDNDSMKIIGEHSGLYNYTIGQKERINQCIFKGNPEVVRHVVKKDVETNTLYVTSSYNSPKYLKPDGIRSIFHVNDIRWIVPDFRGILNRVACNDAGGLVHKLNVKLRHSPNFRACLANFDQSSNLRLNSAFIKLNTADSGISTGQYAAFYVNDQCIGASKMITANV